MIDLNELQNDMNKITLAEDGEDFDESSSFLYCNIESTDLVAVVESTSRTDDDLGRVVIATKDVSIGTTIIRERPVLVYKHEAWLEMVSAFLALGEESKDGVLDMFHPPTKPKLSIVTDANLVASQLSLDPTLVQKLILISNFNAHQYYGCDQERFHEVASFSPSSAGKSALFLFGSKVAHSCNPNVTYSSRTSDGKLEYKVIRPINTGDMITFSYITELLETPTHIRRIRLIETKEFLCRCPRCMGPDFSRAISCNKCKGGDVVLCTDPKGGSPSWSCSGCGELDSVEKQRIHTLENEIKQNLDDLDFKMRMDLTGCLPSEFEKEVIHTSSELHPHHYLTLRSMKMYILLCASQAAEMENLSNSGYPRSMVASIHRKFGTPAKHRSEAARMGISIVEKLECIAVGCNGPESTGRCTKQHAPVQDACLLAFHAAQDMIQCSSSVWPANGPGTVHRYIPAMRLQYGKEDEDVADIERKIPDPKDKQGNHTSPIKKKSISIPNANNKAKPSNKKGGRKNNKKKGRKK
jgi:hypothetical protein